ncbi:hypothetical protein PR202_ga05903 [Eleusine coracana subsp. coracana]|uniref:Uncharacterized protein n=1 Tax=Eleusine coracana subsp. coracana TaxID=191504 RepID=A0AAV5BU17_ELECO|nr:hypothetical protein PR202_ga05903 [Eleusine coracana subsp. coracana]
MEENVRLLPRLVRDGGDGRNAKCGGGAVCTWWSDMAREGGKVGRVALPMAAVSLSQYAVQVASNMMVGHLPGVLPLAASAIATSLATVSGFSLLTSLGFIGASLAISLSYWLNVIMLASYIRYSNSCKETRSLPSIEAFKGIGLFLRLALPSALMLCNDKGVVVYVNAIVPFMCVSVAADSIQGVLSGIARGCGWQHLGAYVNLGSFYLVGIPVALFLGFVLKMEGKGLWMGISCGSVVQFLLLALVTFSSNWQKMSEEARESVFSKELCDSDMGALMYLMISYREAPLQELRCIRILLMSY